MKQDKKATMAVHTATQRPQQTKTIRYSVPPATVRVVPHTVLMPVLSPFWAWRVSR